ncbi:MAG: AbrB/MazE/SpoVT family DNA-binding domain-containing protein [Alicyclobacillaceae bacterium]|nr:AbrB/MazE/SpoVT family DNA-binding domain-containing protein [Alicyclobacillaceae bacterium]
MMKATGVYRRVDELGRVVLPIELRRTKGIEVGDSVEVFVDGERIVLRKYERGCVFCGEVEHVLRFREKWVCRQCRRELRSLMPVTPVGAG